MKKLQDQIRHHLRLRMTRRPRARRQRPKRSDTAHTIASYHAAREHTAMLAKLLIDGIGGAAIIALAVRLRRYLASNRKLTAALPGPALTRS
jgi:hypothetical protein